MKQVLLFPLVLLLSFLSTTTQAQQPFEPSILILSPNKTIVDKKLEKEVAKYNKAMQANRKQAVAESEAALKELEDKPQNIKIMYQKKLEFTQNAGFFSYIPSVAEGYLQYRFFERFTNLLVYATQEKSDGSTAGLNQLSEKHQVAYVLNFPEVTSSLEKGKKRSVLKVQLFDASAGKVILEEVYTGNDQNPGFEFACQDGSLTCTFNNALAQALRDVIRVVASNNPSIQRDRQLAQARMQVLLTEYYPLQPTAELLQIISRKDSNAVADNDGYYNGMMDETKTKFIAFYASNNTKSFWDQKSKDKEVKILTDDLTNLDKAPGIYAYVLTGVKYNGTWYTQKNSVTYFNAPTLEAGRKEYFNNLQQWQFFKEGTDTVDPAFWERYFFEKVEKSVAKNQEQIAELTRQKEKATDPEDKELYQEMIDRYYDTDLKNESYFGLYELVATELKEQDEAQRDKFEAQLATTVLTPFFDKQIQAAGTPVKSYKKFNKEEYALLYPKDKNIILCPILLEMKNGKSELHYFVLIPSKDNRYSVYKWTYFTPVTPEYKNAYGGDINKQLNTITTWNFSFDYLQDRKFWEEYVLKQQAGQFVHLQKLD